MSVRAYVLAELGDRLAMDVLLRREDAWAALEEILEGEPDWAATLFVAPRLVAWRPETGNPASRSVGGRDTGLPVMTVTRMFGYDPVSTLWMVMPAAAGAAATQAAARASASVRTGRLTGSPQTATRRSSAGPCSGRSRVASEPAAST